MAAEVYTPTVTFTVTPERQVSGPEYMLEYRQSQRLSVAASVPDAPVTVEGYEDLDGTDTWVWRRHRSGITSSDGSFSADLPNLPEGTLLRAVVEASADGLRRRAVSEEVATTLTPIPLALDGPQVESSTSLATVVPWPSCRRPLATSSHSISAMPTPWRVVA